MNQALCAALVATYLSGAPLFGAEDLVRLSSALEVFSSAVLARGDRELLIPDPRTGQIWIYNLDGSRRAAVGSDPGAGRALRKPVLLTREPTGWLLLDSAWQLLELDHELRAVKSLRLPGDRSPGATPLELQSDRGDVLDLPVTDYAMLGDSWYLLAEMKDAEGWRSGVIETRLASRGAPRWIRRFSGEEERWFLYRVNLQRALAATSRAAYLLTVHGKPRLEQIAPQNRELELPPPFRVALQQLPTERFGGSRGYSLLYAKLRTMALPVALHVFQDRLYLLTWQPEGTSLRWDLWRLGDDGALSGPMRLDVPPETREVVAAPGDSIWALVLKGRLRDDGSSEVLGLRILGSKELAVSP